MELFFSFLNNCGRLYSVLHLTSGENSSFKDLILMLTGKLKSQSRATLVVQVVACLPNPLETCLIS